MAAPGLSKSARLRHIFDRPGTTLMPFGVLPIHAQMAERAGFEAFEVSGAFTSWWVGGVPDVGLMTMTEVVEHAARVARSVEIPVFCDADTGYGGPLQVRRTVQEFIRAGVAGIHIEDQMEPKKGGGHAGIELVSDEEAIGRLRAAIGARDELDSDFVIVARTDGRDAVGGSLDEAIRRGNLYKRETGADVIFYEGLTSWDEVRTAIAATEGPAYAIPLRAVRHPSVAEMAEIGQKITIVRMAVPGVQEIWKLLLQVRDEGSMRPMDEYLDSLDLLRGTEAYAGQGDAFYLPTLEEVRRVEETYLPEAKRREYRGGPDSH
jgi:methylisocitrate lyase